MLLQIEVKRKMLGRSVTFEPRSVEKRFQQQNFFELTTPTQQKTLMKYTTAVDGYQSYLIPYHFTKNKIETMRMITHSVLRVLLHQATFAF